MQLFSFAAVPNCAEGWQEHNGFCYKFYQTEVTGVQARLACFLQNAYLVDIQSISEEIHIMSSIVPFQSGVTSVSLGYTREESGGFSWERTGQSGSYTRWKLNQPDNAAPGEACTVLDLSTSGPFSGGWDDISCHLNRSFICKRGEHARQSYKRQITKVLEHLMASKLQSFLFQGVVFFESYIIYLTMTQNAPFIRALSSHTFGQTDLLCIQ